MSAPAPAKPAQVQDFNTAVLEFLKKKGYSRAESALRQEIEEQTRGNGVAPPPKPPVGVQAVGEKEAGASTASAQPRAVTLPGLISRTAPVPGSSNGGGSSTPTGEGTRNPAQSDVAAVYNFLLQSLPSSASDALKTPEAITQLGKMGVKIPALQAVAPPRQTPQRPQTNAGTVVLQGHEEAKVLGPEERQEGYRGLEEWVDAGLEGWKPELRQLLFPVFVHTFLELVSTGFPASARKFFIKYAASHQPLHAPLISQLHAITNMSHLHNSAIAKRFREEKYVIKLSKGGFGLLISWLSGGGVEGEWALGRLGARGKEWVRGVINERIHIAESPTTQPLSAQAMLTETGLISGLLDALNPTGNPQVRRAAIPPSTSAFHAGQAPLKLGIPQLSEKLVEEVKREIRTIDGEPNPLDVGAELVAPAAAPTDEASGAATPQADKGSVPPGTEEKKQSADKRQPVEELLPGGADQKDLLIPAESDRLPLPVNFRQFDVKREVERVIDARKRMRLGPNVDAESKWDDSAPGKTALPSICAYTFHDAGEGVTSTIFSPDFSLLAAGSAESCVRIWSLKGERLRGMKSDFDPSNLKDTSSLKKLRERGGSSMRKLIGHSGPVYGLSFDPLNGTSAPPRHLLTSSQDSTIRLWSMDTWSNLVVYKGHQQPVWDVQWGPQGTYFASGGRDRTARLWTTERTTALRMFVGHLGDVDCVKFHPNSLYLATGSTDRTCRLWDVQRGACVRLFIGHHDSAISTIEVSPDGRLLASAGEDLSINIWDLASGRLIKKLLGHTAPISSLSFSAESNVLISGSADCTVRCWDVKTASTDGRIIGTGGPGGVLGGEKKGELPMGGRVDAGTGLQASSSLLATFPTKRTPVLNVQFTPRNLCMMSGVYSTLS